MSFVDTIVLNAIALSERPAMILPDRVVTYSMLGRGIRSVEARTRSTGLKQGTIVAIAIENPIRHLIVACAMFRLGIVTVSIRQEQELAESGIAVDAVLVENTSAWRSHPILVDDDWFDTREQDPSLKSAVRFGADETCRIALSSGTTGLPKPIAFTAAALEHVIASCYPVMHLAPWERMLCLPGITSHFGFGVALFTLHAGRTLLFARAPKEALQLIALYRVDYLTASPQHVIKLLECKSESPIPCDSLRVLHLAGSLPTRALIQKAQAGLCNTVMCVYGSTEAWVMAFAPNGALRGIEGAVGLIAPWADLEIVDSTGTPLPSGTEGRIRVRSPSQGFPYRTSTATAPADEWFYPGDIGRIIENGLVVLTGRSSEVINVGGVKFAPELVEQLILTHPSIQDAAAVGVMGQSDLEEIWVAIVPTGTVNPEDIQTFCAQRDPDFVPDRVFVVKAIPRNEGGKIARAQLRAQLLATTKIA